MDIVREKRLGSSGNSDCTFEWKQERVLGFCGQESQGKKQNISSLKNEAGVLVTSSIISI